MSKVKEFKMKAKYTRKQLQRITAEYNDIAYENLVEQNEDFVKENENLLLKNEALNKKYNKLVKQKNLVDENEDKTYNDLVEQNEDLVKENENMHKKNEALNMKFNDLVQQLRDKVECPVCLDLPKKAPIPVCPNGHVVCATCVRGDCPKCRVKMGHGKSSLAVTVIENIEHECENEGCEEKLSLGELAKHGKRCDFRLVECPGMTCNEKVSLATLPAHMVSCRSVAGGKIRSCKMPKVSYYYSYKKNVNQPGERSWKLNAMLYDENIFVLKVKKYDVNGSVRWLFIVQMVGSEEETDKYGVTIIVHMRGYESSGGKYSLRYCGDVCNIDMASMLAAEQQGLGLTIADGAMKKILGDDGFCVSIDLCVRRDS